MGYALASAALKMGHRVILITGPTSLSPPKKAKTIHVTTAGEMHRAVIKHFPKADVIIKVAAVADYRPAKRAPKKIKKTQLTLTLKLVKNPDILKELGQKKNPHQILVGFAAETNNAKKNALKKLKEKNCDWIVLNSVAGKNKGFESDYNETTLLSARGHEIHWGKTLKTVLASRIISLLLKEGTRPPKTTKTQKSLR